MSLLFLCKLISLNIWVVKFKRWLFYVFVLTLTRTLQTIAKKPQKLTRFLSGCLFFYTVSSGWFLFKGPKTSLTHANVLGFANIVTFTSQVAVPCEGRARNGNESTLVSSYFLWVTTPNKHWWNMKHIKNVFPACEGGEKGCCWVGRQQCWQR